MQLKTDDHARTYGIGVNVDSAYILELGQIRLSSADPKKYNRCNDQAKLF